MSEINGTSGAGGRGRWGVVVALMALYLVVRLPGLMRLPIFGDEAIYIRWAQLVREGHWWVSVVDPKPPGHFWVMALFLGWAKDPLMVARGLSVVAGMLTIPAIMGVCGELGWLVREARTGYAGRDAGRNEMTPPSGWSVGLLTCVLMMFCPFMAFYQRMGLADAWFVLEEAVVVWVGLGCWRIQNSEVGIQNAKCEVRNAKWRGLGWAVGLGVALGVAFMTRQILSYVLVGVVGGGGGWGWGEVRIQKSEFGMRNAKCEVRNGGEW